MDGGKWLQDFAQVLRDCEDPFSEFQSYIKARGGAGYLYGYAGMKSDTTEFNFSKAMFYHHTYGPAWDAVMTNKPAIDDDPTTARVVAGEDFVEWVPDDLPSYEANLTAAQLKLHHAETELGIIYGCSIAIDRSAIGLSGLGFWSAMVASVNEFRQLWDRYGTEIGQGAAILDAHVRNDRPNLLIGLTPREVDCVTWLAVGLRPSEICWKLKISEKTFEKHIANAKSKLKARTRDNAVAKAVLFGLIHV